MKLFPRSFRQLRWKLTLFYTLTSIVAFLIVVLLVVGSSLLWLGTHISDKIVGDLQQQAAQGAPYLNRAKTDPEPLATWLQITATDNDPSSDPFHLQPLFMTVVDGQGRVIASTGPQQQRAGTLIAGQLSPQNQAGLRLVLGDLGGKTSASSLGKDNTLVAIVPMKDSHGHVQGALLLKVEQPPEQLLFSYLFDVIFLGGTLALILTAIIGSVFGYLIARGLTRRLKKLSVAASRWSQGDFSVLAVDNSQDELGEMARQLNHMAEELQNVLKTRQQLATLEERHRLARDLHDSVKQQIFAASLQIASTKLLLRRDVDAAEARLQKTEKLVQQAQQELTSLIRELRPVALEGKNLLDALRELLPQWSQQTEIVANLQVEGSQTLPLTVEEALFRVAQEALSNIARHSKATLVQITLTLSEEQITLSILDNGQGFDPALGQRGVGLRSMQERMQALGGGVHLESTPGQGTRITAFCNRLGVEKQQITRPEASEEQAATLS